jgi:hypothetical protein
MPGTFLSSKERERLTCFPDNIPNWDLITYFTLTDQDHTFIKSYRRDAHRLGRPSALYNALSGLLSDGSR